MADKNEKGYWFSLENGTHIHVGEGETPKQATERVIGKGGIRKTAKEWDKQTEDDTDEILGGKKQESKYGANWKEGTALTPSELEVLNDIAKINRETNLRGSELEKKAFDTLKNKYDGITKDDVNNMVHAYELDVGFDNDFEIEEEPKGLATKFKTEKEYKDYIYPEIEKSYKEYKQQGMSNKQIKDELTDAFYYKDLIDKVMGNDEIDVGNEISAEGREETLNQYLNRVKSIRENMDKDEDELNDWVDYIGRRFGVGKIKLKTT